MNEARDELKWSVKRRTKIAIEENDTHYEEKETTKLFENGDSSEFDATVAYLMERNGALTKEVRNLKIE